MLKVTYRNTSFYVPVKPEMTNSRDVGFHYWYYDNRRAFITYIEYLWRSHWNVLKTMHAPARVLELFAGIGASSSYIADNISTHCAIDHDKSGMEAFKRVHPKADMVVGDTYEIAPEILEGLSFDYILYEHNALTFYRALREEREKKLFDAVMAHKADHVLFVDSAVVKLHLHTKTYGKFFGREIKLPKEDGLRSYFEAVSNYLYGHYGYSIMSVTRDGINAGVLLHRKPPADFDIVDTRNTIDMNQLVEEEV